MQWSQIKTIFILAFLILDVYLLVQFMDKQQQENIDLLESIDSTIEEQLETDNIDYELLPDEDLKESYISVGQREFSEEELTQLNNIKNINALSINENLLVAEFEKPIALPTNGSDETIAELIKESFIFPDDYMYWDWNEEMNVLIFFQREKEERPIYYNRNGVILVFLNDENEMIFYTQTMLDKDESNQDKKSLIKPIKVLETLYNANTLQSGDSVSEMDLGFHTRVPLENGVQVFVPTWKVNINENRHYFVNAIEGFVFSSNENEFLEESVMLYIDRVNGLSEKVELKNHIKDLLQKRLEAINRGGI